MKNTKNFEDNKYRNLIDELYNGYVTITKEGTSQKRLRWINGILSFFAFLSFFGLIYDFITNFFFKAYFLPCLYNGILIVFSIVFFFCSVLRQLERNRMYKHLNIKLESPKKIFQEKARNQYKQLIIDEFEKKLIDNKLLYNNAHDIELILLFIKTIETYIKKTGLVNSDRVLTFIRKHLWNVLSVNLILRLKMEL